MIKDAEGNLVLRLELLPGLGYATDWGYYCVGIKFIRDSP